MHQKSEITPIYIYGDGIRPNLTSDLSHTVMNGEDSAGHQQIGGLSSSLRLLLVPSSVSPQLLLPRDPSREIEGSTNPQIHGLGMVGSSPSGPQGPSTNLHLRRKCEMNSACG